MFINGNANWLKLLNDAKKHISLMTLNNKYGIY